MLHRSEAAVNWLRMRLLLGYFPCAGILPAARHTDYRVAMRSLFHRNELAALERTVPHDWDAPRYRDRRVCSGAPGARRKWFVQVPIVVFGTAILLGPRVVGLGPLGSPATAAAYCGSSFWLAPEPDAMRCRNPVPEQRPTMQEAV